MTNSGVFNVTFCLFIYLFIFTMNGDLFSPSFRIYSGKRKKERKKKKKPKTKEKTSLVLYQNNFISIFKKLILVDMYVKL